MVHEVACQVTAFGQVAAGRREEARVADTDTVSHGSCWYVGMADHETMNKVGKRTKTADIKTGEAGDMLLYLPAADDAQ